MTQDINTIKTGSIVMINKKLAVIIGLAGDLVNGQLVPDDHFALWFGGISESDNNEAWTVPSNYCIPVHNVNLKH